MNLFRDYLKYLATLFLSVLVYIFNSHASSLEKNITEIENLKLTISENYVKKSDEHQELEKLDKK